MTEIQGSPSNPALDYSNYNPNILSEDIEVKTIPLNKFREFKQRFPDEPDETVARFLIARKYDVEKAIEMLTNHIRWRAANFPVYKDSVLDELKKGICYQHGVDKLGHPLFIFTPLLNDPKSRNLDAMIRSILWWIQYGISKLPENKSKFTVLVNRHGSNQSNADFELGKALSKIMNDNFPEQCYMFIAHPINVVFYTIWAIAKLFLDPVTQQRVKPIVYQAAIQDIIDPMYIPIQMVKFAIILTFYEHSVNLLRNRGICRVVLVRTYSTRMTLMIPFLNLH